MESPAPTFHALGIRPPLEDTLRRLGFERPTPIQEKAIPPVLAGRDVVGSAETGSGKTAAYLLPALSRLLAGTREGQTRMLVLVPTRELAQQVHAVVTELAAGTDLACIPVYGGTVMEGQALAMRGGVDIVVATPGRLIDLMGRATTKLDGLKILVLDEADRMLDMGFLPDIKRILARLPSGRQTLLFSATMPPEIVDLARTVLREPERVRIGNPRTTKAPVGITHAIFPVPGHRKTALLEVLLRRGNMASVLVFVRTKGRADQLERELARLGFSCGVLHSDRSQADRERDLSAFVDGYLKILVATDVAARGLDVEGISHVVNYDFPRTPEDYLHRVGRTARAQAKGDAFTLVSPEEEGEVGAVEREMGASIPRVTLPEFDYRGGPRGAGPQGRGDRDRGRDRGRGGGGGRGRPGGGGRGRMHTGGPGRGGPARPAAPPPAAAGPEAGFGPGPETPATGAPGGVGGSPAGGGQGGGPPSGGERPGGGRRRRRRGRR